MFNTSLLCHKPTEPEEFLCCRVTGRSSYHSFIHVLVRRVSSTPGPLTAVQESLTRRFVVSLLLRRRRLLVVEVVEKELLIMLKRLSLPYATVTEDDHTAWILIAAILGIIYSFVFCSIRVVARRSIGRSFERDEATLLVSMVRRPFCGLVRAKHSVSWDFVDAFAFQCIAVVQSIVTINAVRGGLGKSWDLIAPNLQGWVQKVTKATTLPSYLRTHHTD